MNRPLERWEHLQPRRTRVEVSGYASLGEIVSKTAERIFTPAETITVSAGAEKYANIELAGAWAQFSNATAPYMVEPMNETESRHFTGLVFVSSAQSGKTASLILNKMSYNIKVSGMDMMVVCQSAAAALDFAIRRVDRVIRNSPYLKQQILEVRNSDNQKRKHFKNGMLLTITHPSKNELSGKPVGCVAITDYDRLEDDIDGEGPAWNLGQKRTTTFKSYAMTIAESSPSRPVIDHKKLLEDHEAPDTTGILALYNQGDRRLWYWPCPACDEYFTPKWELIGWDDTLPNNMDKAETVHMSCPACEHKIHPDDRHEMQQWGIWLAAGQRMVNGVIEGTARRAKTASFWLEGTAAAFITWGDLLLKYLDARKEMEDKGDEKPMMTFYNTDLGRAYVTASADAERTPESLMARKEELGDRVVPEGGRAVIITCDVQKNRWECQAHVIMPGRPADIVVIDRFDISKSLRFDGDGDPYMVRPATFSEDWDLLIDQCILKSYPLADGSGRRMQVKLVVCDSQGAAAYFDSRGVQSGSGGVTEKAYAFQRELQRRGLAGRFHLVRGTNTRTGKRAWIDKPDSSDRGKFAIARGDVPVLYLNSNEVKDILSNRLEVMEQGSGMIRFADWLPDWFFGEMCAEVWTDKGWKATKKRNEAWDLLYYLIGAMMSPLLNMDRVDWDKPPPWLLPWDDNPFVLPAPVVGEPDAPRQLAFERPKIDFAALGASLG